jgi:hypothetical protein
MKEWNKKGMEKNKRKEKGKHGWTEPANFKRLRFLFHAEVTRCLLDIHIQLTELWIHFLKLMQVNIWTRRVQLADLVDVSCGSTQFSKYTLRAGQNIPFLVNLKFQRRVKWLLVYRYFIFNS